MDARALIVSVLFVLAGCATRETVPIRVPYAIPCQQSVPARPAMPTDSLVPPVKIDPWVAAAQSELDVREGYEVELVARLRACLSLGK